MLVRELAYSLMKDSYLREKVERNAEKLKSELTYKERAKILNDNFDVMGALIRKYGADKNFVNYAKKSLTESIIRESK